MNEETNIEQQTGFSFGRRFSTARGALNLSREEVAKQLKLGVEIIAALENEDYERLTAPIYVTGYIRNYARLLKIPVEPLLAAYKQVQVESPRIIATSIRKSGSSYGRLLIKLASVVIVLVLFAGVFSWFQNQNFEPSTWFSSPKSTDNAEPEITLPELLDDEPLRDEATPSKDIEPELMPEALLPELHVEDVTIPEVVPEPQPEPIKSPVEVANNEIVLNLSSDSWVDIKDSTGKRLIYELLRAGKQKKLSGQPPFKVFLGNAKGVKIEYNGEPFDVDKYKEGKLARFKIGKATE